MLPWAPPMRALPPAPPAAGPQASTAGRPCLRPCLQAIDLSQAAVAHLGVDLRGSRSVRSLLVKVAAGALAAEAHGLHGCRSWPHGRAAAHRLRATTAA